MSQQQNWDALHSYAGKDAATQLTFPLRHKPCGALDVQLNESCTAYLALFAYRGSSHQPMVLIQLTY